MDTELVREVLERLDLYGRLRPTNHDAERERFLDAAAAGETYDPQYAYEGLDDRDAVEGLIGQVAVDADDALGERLVAALRERLRTVAAIGTDRITDVSTNVYGEPDAETVAAARELFHPPQDDGETTVAAAELVGAFEDLFDRLDADYGAVTGDETRNEPERRRVAVADHGWTGAAARRLLVHESTHAVRALNGMAAGHPALVYGTDGYETMEEGLATFNEQAAGVFAGSVPRITARVIAVDAMDRPFHEVYGTMRELGLGERIAFIRTHRVKRGLVDTGQRGGFRKDHIYFQGYRVIDANPGLADALYAGKVGRDDLDLVEGEPDIDRDAHLAAYRAAVDGRGWTS